MLYNTGHDVSLDSFPAVSITFSLKEILWPVFLPMFLYTRCSHAHWSVIYHWQLPTPLAATHTPGIYYHWGWLRTQDLNEPGVLIKPGIYLRKYGTWVLLCIKNSPCDYLPSKLVITWAAFSLKWVLQAVDTHVCWLTISNILVGHKYYYSFK